MYQAGTNGTPNANLTESLSCVGLGCWNDENCYLFVVVSCVFDRSIEYFVMSLMPSIDERYDHLIRCSIDNVGCNVCKCVSCYVDEFEALLHGFCHAVREAVTFLAHVFFERVTPPPSHFLDMHF